MSPKTILAFLGGAAAGAALGMLLSSEKGSKIRKDIANKARGLADAVLEKANIPHAYCWSHARREFFNLESHDISVKPILDLIDELFKIERKAKNFEQLKILRSSESTEVIKNLKKVLLLLKCWSSRLL